MGIPPINFSFKTTGDGRALIAWHGRVVVTLTGHKAAKFIHDSAGLAGSDPQLLLARVTGNFRHGNERPPRKK